MKTTWIAPLFALALAPIACTDDGEDHDQDDHADEHGTDTSGDGDGDGEPFGDGDGEPMGDGDGEPTGDGDGEGLCGAPSCEDALVLDLGLQGGELSEGVIANQVAGDDWLSTVDASAGGTMEAPMNPWVYARFTDEGLVKVEIDDLEALESGDWDIAAKRFGIRVNSGSSGPGCVGVAAFDGDLEQLAEVPAGTEFAAEAFYDDQCVLIEDMSGLPGNPNYRMHGWWGYTGCVSTTGAVYLIELDDGRVVAFTVDAYYAEGQEQCNEQGTMGSGSANFSWRWRFLD